MKVVRHEFTDTIIDILEQKNTGKGEKFFLNSPLIQYINIKTKAANKGSKSRAAFANLYAIYVLVEDYIKNGYADGGGYNKYDGAQFSSLLNRQRELPFGSKLQNHALNHRLNEEFKKYFPVIDELPIIRDVQSNRYWINEGLLSVEVDDQNFNTAREILRIIESYVRVRMSSFDSFVGEFKALLELDEKEYDTAVGFIRGLLRPNVDARIFEIVSYSILKYAYSDKVLFWGWSRDNLNEDNLVIYKTGRTNANDGGIDFVMKPLGRFFQVTETIDAGKYFLDIDKVQRYPITFVVKTDEEVEKIREKIKHQATNKYKIEKVVDRYMDCIEEIINNVMLIEYFEEVIASGKAGQLVDEIILQSKVEFNVEDEEELSSFYEDDAI